MRLAIAWHNLRAKPVINGLTVLVVAATLTLMTVVTLLSDGVHTGLVKATEPFDLIAGVKGSPNQLVLSTVFLQDAPIGNVHHEVYENLSRNPLVAAAIPLALGDNYKGHSIVGAGAEIFQHQMKAGQPPWLQLETGRAFSQSFEAVIGAKAARELGLTVGDEFRSIHGALPGGQDHDQPYRVVGILKPVHGPYDQAILVSIDSIWQSHANHESEHQENQAVTAVLIKPKGYSEAMRLYQQFQQNPEGQIVFPAQVIVQLFAILGQGEQITKTITVVITGMGLFIMALSVYWSALSRARERAILRALGASARDILTIIVAESGMLTFLGVMLGWLAGHGIYAALAMAMESKTAIVLSAGFIPGEALLIMGGTLFGLLAGTIPALLTYRMEVTQYL